MAGACSDEGARVRKAPFSHLRQRRGGPAPNLTRPRKGQWNEGWWGSNFWLGAEVSGIRQDNMTWEGASGT